VSDSLAPLLQHLEHVTAKISAERIKQRSWETERRKLLLKVEDKKELTAVLLKVVEVFKQLGGDSEAQVLEKIQSFVSYGLSAVFGQGYSFVASVGQEGKDLRVDFHIETEGLRSRVIGAKGGGVAEVTSILLQIFFVLIERNLSRFIVLDAALIHLSEKYWKNMSQLLSELCHQTDIQILLMAHAGDYGEYADTLYKFSQKKGKTIAYRIK